MQAIHKLFNHPLPRKIFLALRYPIVLALLIAVALAIKPDLLYFGMAVSLLGEVLQVWCFASLVKNEELTARGPYVMVRNPMYLGRYFLILGFILLTGNLYVVIGYTVFYYFYMVNRVGREEKRLHRLLGEPYAQYCASTRPFLPHFARAFRPEVRFWSWSVMTHNNGHWNFLSWAVSWLLVTVYTYWLMDRIVGLIS